MPANGTRAGYAGDCGLARKARHVRTNEALWPEAYPIDALHRIRRNTSARFFSALYQQQPAPEEGDYFKAEWLRPYDKAPACETLKICGASDMAVTANGGDFTVHTVVGVDPNWRIYVLDLWRAQTSSADWVESFCDLVERWKLIGWAEETGQIRAGIGPFLEKRMRERQTYIARKRFPTRGDKAVRAHSIRGRMELDGLYVPTHAPVPRVLKRTTELPCRKTSVDALGLIGQLLAHMNKGVAPPNPDQKIRFTNEMTMDEVWQLARPKRPDWNARI